VRHSFWSIMIGGFFFICNLYATSQMTAQRYMGMKTLQAAQRQVGSGEATQILKILNLNLFCRIILLNIPMNIAMMVMYTMIGLLMYATYQNDRYHVFSGLEVFGNQKKIQKHFFFNFFFHRLSSLVNWYQCDPHQAGHISKSDQLLPYYVMDRLHTFMPGITGVFVAAIYGAALRWAGMCDYYDSHAVLYRTGSMHSVPSFSSARRTQVPHHNRIRPECVSML
jgi:sodium-coupled monocarboxylate transporter 8/12